VNNAFVQLLRIFNRAGLSVRIGLNPAHFRPGFNYLQFCYLFKDGRQLSTGAGITLPEVFFFQSLFEICHPQNIFIVGNAFGWSTILLAICNPQARVVAIDSGIEGADAMAGINLTNEIIRQNSLNAEVIYGSSPGDVPQAAEKLAGPMDFAFIDGLHTNQQQDADFKAVQAVAAPNCIYAFHDVVDWKTTESFYRIARTPNYVARIMLRTPSGMGILYPVSDSGGVAEVVNAFSHDPSCSIPAMALSDQAPIRHLTPIAL
jgi:predicted O-methyltransferase YrrM